MANSVSFNKNYPEINKSLDLLNKAKELIPSVTQTLAKGPTQYSEGVCPVYIKYGKGSHIWDVDGNEYIDYNMGIGPLSLGYCYDKVDNAIIEQLKSGITFSQMHPLEYEVAELIHQIIPNAEFIRFSKTGCDVTSAAVRLARAYTGKNTILCCGYHGWHDWYISVTDRNRGIPDDIKNLTFTFNYNDINSVLDSIDDDTAGIILEPVVFEEPKDNFLHKIREICTQNNIVLIFDEMWTGFRIALGGAQEYFGVKADLATFSKAIANGMPISVLVGRKDIMKLLDSDVFFYTTFGGEALSLAAAKATINEMIEKNVITHIWNQGQKLKDGIQKMLSEIKLDFIKINGYPFRTQLVISENSYSPLQIKTYIQQELVKRGILWSGFHTISFSHNDEDIEYTLEAYYDVFTLLKKAIEEENLEKLIRGKLLQPVFRRVSNFNTKPKKI